MPGANLSMLIFFRISLVRAPQPGSSGGNNPDAILIGVIFKILKAMLKQSIHGFNQLGAARFNFASYRMIDPSKSKTCSVE
jgi:hypothetical protein